jgi:hypothetical protein
MKRPQTFIRIVATRRHNAVPEIECVKPFDFGDFSGEFSAVYTDGVFHSV